VERSKLGMARVKTSSQCGAGTADAVR
jgi:hypothetical protein